MKLDDRLDGHLVLGHVDGVATLDRLDRLSGAARVKMAHFRANEDVTRYIVSKGSVALDGVSLTVIDVEGEFFSVGLIPTTLEMCTLGQLELGDAVNVETDVIGKYVEKYMDCLLSRESAKASRSVRKVPKTSGVTLEEMYELGYR